MAEPINPEHVDQDFIDYFTDYFETTMSGVPWNEAVVSASGIEMIINDTRMLTEGLSHSLNIPEPIMTVSGTALDIEAPVPDTNTARLYQDLWMWNEDQQTTYSEYIFGKMVALMAAEEPTYKLGKWLGISSEKAEITWNMLNLYLKDQNLTNAYVDAVKAVQDGQIPTMDENL